jgi:hypothetical protein
MLRRIALTVAFGLAVPAAAFACHDKEQTKQANTTTDGQQIVLAQADTPKPAKKKKKAKKTSTTAPKTDTTK